MFRPTKPGKSGKPESAGQRDSRIDRLIAPVKQLFRSPSPRASPSSQQTLQPSPVPPPHSGPPPPTPHPQTGEQGGSSPGKLSEQDGDLWSKAFKQLPEEYKKDLDNLDKMDILQKLFVIAKQAEEQNAAKQFKLKWGDKEIDVGEKAAGFVGCLNKFKEIGDIVVQYDPVHVALPWAGVRFILMVYNSPQLLCGIVLTSPS